MTKIKHLPSQAYEPYVPSKAAFVRPGGMDAYELPSRVGDQRHPYKPPSNGCVGVLKDRTSHTGQYQENRTGR